MRIVGKIRAYVAELMTPTNYRGYLGTLNQTGHVLVGMILGAVPFYLGLIGYVAFELWQGRGARNTRDIVADTAFVTIGALIHVAFGFPAMTGAWLAVAILSGPLAFGVLTSRGKS